MRIKNKFTDHAEMEELEVKVWIFRGQDLANGMSNETESREALQGWFSGGELRCRKLRKQEDHERLCRNMTQQPGSKPSSISLGDPVQVSKP